MNIELSTEVIENLYDQETLQENSSSSVEKYRNLDTIDDLLAKKEDKPYVTIKCKFESYHSFIQKKNQAILDRLVKDTYVRHLILTSTFFKNITPQFFNINLEILKDMLPT